MPVLKTLQNPSKSAKIKNSRQAYPYGIVHMVRVGWPRTFFDRLSRPVLVSEAIIANVRPTFGCVHGHSSRTPAIVLPQHVLVPVRCIVFRFRFYISYFRFGFGFIISARQRTLTNADERTIHIRQFHTPTCSIQGRSLWPTLNWQIRWGCVTVTHPIISDSLLYTPAIQVGQSDLPPSSNTNQRCRG